MVFFFFLSIELLFVFVYFWVAFCINIQVSINYLKKEREGEMGGVFEFFWFFFRGLVISQLKVFYESWDVIGCRRLIFIGLRNVRVRGISVQRRVGGRGFGFCVFFICLEFKILLGSCGFYSCIRQSLSWLSIEKERICVFFGSFQKIFFRVLLI